VHLTGANARGTESSQIRRWSGMDSNVQFRARSANGFVGSSELEPIYRRTGHPSSRRPRRTGRVVGRRSGEPPLTARIRRRHTTAALHHGTKGSNPFRSSGESANHRFFSGDRPIQSPAVRRSPELQCDMRYLTPSPFDTLQPAVRPLLKKSPQLVWCSDHR
jgi:hypothetical protein